MSDSETVALLGRGRAGRSVMSFCQKFAYSVGHVLNDLTASMWFSYMIIYFHQVKDFNNGLAGILVLIGQISDAIFTPFIGYESDRVKGLFNMGKRKTWHFIGTLCVAVSFPFLFVGCISCNEAPDISQFVYYAPFVVIFQFGWASTQISHLSLIPDLTSDPAERTGLNGSRYAFTVLSNMVVYGIAWAIFDLSSEHKESTMLGPGDTNKFRLLVLIVVAIGIVFSVMFHIGVKEHATTPSACKSKGSFSQCSVLNSVETSMLKKQTMLWKCWLKEHQFYQIAAIYMSTRLVVNVSQVYLPMYITETIKLDKDAIAIVPLIVYVSGFITSLLMKYVNIIVGRKGTYLLGAAFCAGASAAFFFLEQGSKLLYGAAVASGIGGSTILVTSLAMTADLIADNTESGAFVYGAMSFTDKLSNGVAIVLIQQFHPCGGNNSGCCPLCNGYYRHIMTFVPGGFSVLAAVILLTLIPQTLGNRRKQIRVLGPILNNHNNHTPNGGLSSTAEVLNESTDETEGLIDCAGAGKTRNHSIQ